MFLAFCLMALLQTSVSSRYKGRNFECVFGPCLENDGFRVPQSNLEAIFGVPAKLMVVARLNDIQDNTKKSYCPFGMCENMPDYPTSDVDQMMDDMIEQRPDLMSYFGTVMQPVEDTINIHNRINNADLEKAFCEQQQLTKKPQRMRDVDGYERAIINTGKYTQAIQFERCTNVDEECTSVQPFLGKDYRTRCVQKHVTVQLAYIKMDNRSFNLANFSVPTTCVCMYKTNK